MGNFRAGIALAIATAVLAGCQLTNDERETPTLGDASRAIVANLLGRGAETIDARDAITPAILAQVGTPVLLIVQRDVDQGVTLVPAGVGADGTVQWRDATGAGLLTRGGVLVGTRGIGFDLLTVDARGTRAALAAGGGRDVLRVERHLRSDDVIVTRDYLCDVVAVDRQVLAFYGRNYPTAIFEERCAGEGPSFVNRYWVGGDGAVRRSEVLVSPEAGVLELNLLRD